MEKALNREIDILLKNHLKEIKTGVVADVVPLVGIWWLHDGEVLDYTTKYNRAEKRELSNNTLYVPTDSHMSLWGQVKAEYPELSNETHKSIPRGRVLISRSNEGLKAVIFCSDRMKSELEQNDKLKKMILRKHRALNLPVEIVEDSHYGVNPKVFEETLKFF